MGLINTKFENSSKGDVESPGEPAYPDDQGSSKTCTGHSLSKAMVDGYNDGIFPPKKLDFSQEEAKDQLLKFYPHKNKGKWPDEFDGITIPLKDNLSGESYNSTLFVCTIGKDNMLKVIPTEKVDGTWTKKQNRSHTFLMVYPCHTVYLKNVFEKNLNGKIGLWTNAINSHLNDPIIVKDVHSKQNTFYQVSCIAKLQCQQFGTGANQQPVTSGASQPVVTSGAGTLQVVISNGGGACSSPQNTGATQTTSSCGVGTVATTSAIISSGPETGDATFTAPNKIPGTPGFEAGSNEVGVSDLTSNKKARNASNHENPDHVTTSLKIENDQVQTLSRERVYSTGVIAQPSVGRTRKRSMQRAVSIEGSLDASQQVKIEITSCSIAAAKSFGTLNAISHEFEGPGYGEKTFPLLKDDNELIALSKCIKASMKKGNFGFNIPELDIHEALKMKIRANNFMEDRKKLLRRFHRSSLEFKYGNKECSIQLRIRPLDMAENMEFSSGSFILHYPVDFMEPNGVKRFAHIPEFFTYEGYTIAYCEKDNQYEEECINIGRKGNVLYRIETYVTPGFNDQPKLVAESLAIDMSQRYWLRPVTRIIGPMIRLGCTMLRPIGAVIMTVAGVAGLQSVAELPPTAKNLEEQILGLPDTSAECAEASPTTFIEVQVKS